jgi:putative transposase
MVILTGDVGDGLVHHSDRGVQYLSIRYTERLAEAGIEASVGSKGDSYDNALAEAVNAFFKTEVIYRGSCMRRRQTLADSLVEFPRWLFKTEVIYRRGPWRSREAVELATLEWVDWFNNRRLLDPLGYVPPAEFEAAYYDKRTDPAMVVGFN